MIRIYPVQDFNPKLLPIPAPLHRAWWQDNDKTKNHAQHCLPLSMANSLGYYILSPGTFKVTWDGDTLKDAEVTVFESQPNCVIDAHAAYGSFTVQPGFIPQTDNPGELIYIRGIANERGLPYSCMEALIESWWTPANFGLVYLLNQPGEFMIMMGQPIAQMCVYLADGGNHKLKVETGQPPGRTQWLDKRRRPDYVKDLDYLKGLHPDGRKEPTHLSAWDRTK